MITLFENDDLILKLTGHDYDFVGTIKIKSDKPLTFFFEEDICPVDEDEVQWEVDESQTKLIDVHAGLETNENAQGDCEKEEDVAMELGASSYFTRSSEDGWLGFLSDCQQRGWLLALVKHYCPEKLKFISWA